MKRAAGERGGGPKSFNEGQSLAIQTSEYRNPTTLSHIAKLYHFGENGNVGDAAVDGTRKLEKIEIDREVGVLHNAVVVCVILKRQKL